MTIRVLARRYFHSQPDVFAPDYAPEGIAEIAAKLREEAGMSENRPGVVAKDE